MLVLLEVTRGKWTVATINQTVRSSWSVLAVFALVVSTLSKPGKRTVGPKNICVLASTDIFRMNRTFFYASTATF